MAENHTPERATYNLLCGFIGTQASPTACYGWRESANAPRLDQDGKTTTEAKP
jgi:hypothetical protein